MSKKFQHFAKPSLGYLNRKSQNSDQGLKLIFSEFFLLLFFFFQKNFFIFEKFENTIRDSEGKYPISYSKL